MIHLIALQGTGGTGKSTTISLVLELLEAKYPNARITFHRKGYRDFMAVIEINGIKIGIESQGDPNSKLEESLKYFVKINCKIVFCAVRTRGMTVDWVLNCKKADPIEFVPQPYVTGAKQLQANKSTAEKLIAIAGL